MSLEKQLQAAKIVPPSSFLKGRKIAKSSISILLKFAARIKMICQCVLVRTIKEWRFKNTISSFLEMDTANFRKRKMNHLTKVFENPSLNLKKRTLFSDNFARRFFYKLVCNLTYVYALRCIP